VLGTAVAMFTGTIAPAAAGVTAVAAGETGGVVGGAALDKAGVVTDLPAGVPEPPAPTAEAWLLADLESGDVIASSGAHTPLAPASTLKVLTALALLPQLDTKRPYVARAADASAEGSSVGLVTGSRYTVNDLLHGLMLGSGNDTASAFATLAGGLDKATTTMTEKARELRAEDTVVRNTSGLDAPGQVSSVYDLALIGRAALADPTLGKVMATAGYRFPAEGTALDGERERFEIQNHNKLLYNFDGATGGKTGYTDAARHTYIGSAERNGRRYVVTMLKGEGRLWQQAGVLFDWAFGPGAKAEPVGTLVEPRQSEPAVENEDDDGAAAAAVLPASPASGEDSPGVPAPVLVVVAVMLAGAVVVATTDIPGPWRRGTVRPASAGGISALAVAVFRRGTPGGDRRERDGGYDVGHGRNGYDVGHGRERAAMDAYVPTMPTASAIPATGRRALRTEHPPGAWDAPEATAPRTTSRVRATRPAPAARAVSYEAPYEPSYEARPTRTRAEARGQRPAPERTPRHRA
jgi:D-alanyl-D-alanine carboxypeptidase (penicillin-binding protein 5/6)